MRYNIKFRYDKPSMARLARILKPLTGYGEGGLWEAAGLSVGGVWHGITIHNYKCKCDIVMIELCDVWDNIELFS